MTPHIFKPGRPTTGKGLRSGGRKPAVADAPSRGQETYPGSEFTPDELAFHAAVEAYRKHHKVRFMAVSDYLRVARSLGYALPGTPPPIPQTPKPARTRRRL